MLHHAVPFYTRDDISTPGSSYGTSICSGATPKRAPMPASWAEDFPRIATPDLQVIPSRCTSCKACSSDSDDDDCPSPIVSSPDQANMSFLDQVPTYSLRSFPEQLFHSDPIITVHTQDKSVSQTPRATLLDAYTATDNNDVFFPLLPFLPCDAAETTHDDVKGAPAHAVPEKPRAVCYLSPAPKLARMPTSSFMHPVQSSGKPSNRCTRSFKSNEQSGRGFFWNPSGATISEGGKRNDKIPGIKAKIHRSRLLRKDSSTYERCKASRTSDEVKCLVASRPVIAFTLRQSKEHEKLMDFLESVADASVVELEALGDRGRAIEKALKVDLLTKSLPAVFVSGSYLGDYDDLVQAEADGRLDGILGHSENAYDYDLFVIGGGSGGLSAAKEAAALGKKVGVADYVHPTPSGKSWGPGGTCVNVGCIPKKLMHHAAMCGDRFKLVKHFGWNITVEKHDWNALVARIQDYIKSLNWNTKKELKKRNVQYFKGRASFVNDHKIKVDLDGESMVVSARNILIATGTRPRYPGIENDRQLCITSDDLFSLTYPPGKTLVVGASYVGLECAGFLKALGFDITVVVRSRILNGFDEQLAELLRYRMEDRDIKFLDKCVLSGIEKVADGEPPTLRAKCTFDDGGEHIDEYNTVLLAIGRDMKLTDLRLDAVGVKLNPESGRIIGDEWERTSVRNILVVGDALDGRPELTPVAIQAGTLLARRLFARSRERMRYELVPTTVFTPVEYGCVGLSEEKAYAYFGGAVRVYHSSFTPLEHKLDLDDDHRSYAKIVCVLCPEGNDVTDSQLALSRTGVGAVPVHTARERRFAPPAVPVADETVRSRCAQAVVPSSCPKASPIRSGGKICQAKHPKSAPAPICPVTIVLNKSSIETPFGNTPSEKALFSNCCLFNDTSIASSTSAIGSHEASSHLVAPSAKPLTSLRSSSKTSAWSSVKTSCQISASTSARHSSSTAGGSCQAAPISSRSSATALARQPVTHSSSPVSALRPVSSPLVQSSAPTPVVCQCTARTSNSCQVTTKSPALLTVPPIAASTSAHQEDSTLPGPSAYPSQTRSDKMRERIVGFHLLAPGAGEVTQGFSVAIRMGVTRGDLESCIGIHPTIAEIFIKLTEKREGDTGEEDPCCS